MFRRKIINKPEDLVDRHTGELLPGTAELEREAVVSGFPKDFRLPYPFPRNEHEEGMNWVAVNKVVSGRAGL